MVLFGIVRYIPFGTVLFVMIWYCTVFICIHHFSNTLLYCNNGLCGNDKIRTVK